MAHRGSILFNHMLLYALQTGRLNELDLNADNLYLQCFIYGGTTCNGKPSRKTHIPRLMEDAMAECKPFLESMPLERLEGDKQAILYKARQFKSNFHNSVWMNFEARQKQVLRCWCVDNGLDPKKDMGAIICAINGWGCRKEVHADAQARPQIGRGGASL